MAILLIWSLVSLMLGWLGRNRKLGFWGYFFASIALTPIIGLLLLLASDPKKPVA